MSYETLKSTIVMLALLASLSVFSYRIYRLLWVALRRGQPSEPFGQWLERFKGLLVYVAGQRRLFRFLPPGTAHFFIFWGFLVLSLTILQAIVEGVVAFINPHFVLPVIGDFGPLALLQDLFAVFVVLAVLYALYVRLIEDPERYRASHKGEGVLVLLFIFAIMVSLLVMNGIRINLGVDPTPKWKPVSQWVGSLFVGLGAGVQRGIEETAYWIHLGVVLVFLTELPGGKHFHVVTSLPAVFLRNLDPVGQLPSAPEFNGDIGVNSVERFRWRQMLDFYTCTECGRCQEVCPAYASGLPLSPKLLMMSLRDELIERSAEWTPRLVGAANPAPATVELVGKALSEEELWACTTCLACDQECPLFIEHVIPIVDVRRHLVIEGRMDEMLQEALSNLGRYGNSFGQSERARAKWTRGIEPKVKDARREPVEYLWFLGDYASYNPVLIENTKKVVEVFRRVGADFGILYDGERNAGNDVRRVGEEGLFEMLVEANMAELDRCEYQVLVTTDPHSYNTLKNEYPFENGRPVLHYSELLYQWIQEGRLELNSRLKGVATYHDPCYLGRYNGVYEPPRRVIEAAGCTLVEMENHHDRAICCGAGGGCIWMEEGEVEERPSEMRIREAADIKDLRYFVVACPKDVAMYQDAVKTTGYERQIEVKDLIELVYESL